MRPPIAPCGAFGSTCTPGGAPALPAESIRDNRLARATMARACGGGGEAALSATAAQPAASIARTPRKIDPMPTRLLLAFALASPAAQDSPSPTLAAAPLPVYVEEWPQ